MLENAWKWWQENVVALSTPGTERSIVCSKKLQLILSLKYTMESIFILIKIHHFVQTRAGSYLLFIDGISNDNVNGVTSLREVIQDNAHEIVTPVLFETKLYFCHRYNLYCLFQACFLNFNT